MIKLKPCFHMIATIAVIAAIAEKKKNFSDRSDHMKPLSSDRSDNNRWDIKSSISAIVVAAIAGVVSIWSLNFFFSAIVAIIWKPGLIYRNNHPPFLLNCYLYALQTYRTHFSKLRLLLVLNLNCYCTRWFAFNGVSGYPAGVLPYMANTGMCPWTEHCQSIGSRQS